MKVLPQYNKKNVAVVVVVVVVVVVRFALLNFQHL